MAHAMFHHENCEKETGLTNEDKILENYYCSVRLPTERFLETHYIAQRSTERVAIDQEIDNKTRHWSVDRKKTATE